jgi:Ulp1 family protease
MKAESFIDVKIGDYKITVKSMNDLKNGYWLNDEVRN